jgi:molybdenum cofactor cytidylyltransferase
MEKNIAAIVLAGGYSSRMQRFKPLLPLNGTTVIENVIRNFQQSGITSITVVVGHNAAALMEGVKGLGVQVVFNSRYAEGMYSSVVAGVGSLNAHTDGCLLTPADMPLVRRSTVTRVCDAFCNSDASVVYPVFRKRRGHPILISSRLFPAILSGDGAEGLRAVLAQYDQQARTENVLDEGVLIDLDTPADYEKAKKEFGHREIPTAKECEAILEQLQTPANVICHERRVAEVAGELALRLNKAGCALNTALINAAALLHDVAKGRPDHAGAGERILEELGFARVGRIVGLHMDYEFDEGAGLDEAAIVYLADKLVQGDRVVPLVERFQHKFATAGANGTLPFVQKRWDTAKQLAEVVERMVGSDLQRIVQPIKNHSTGEVADVFRE